MDLRQLEVSPRVCGLRRVSRAAGALGLWPSTVREDALSAWLRRRIV